MCIIKCQYGESKVKKMLGQPSKSSESTQVKIWQIFCIAGLILFAEYLTIMSFLALQ